MSLSFSSSFPNAGFAQGRAVPEHGISLVDALPCQLGAGAGQGLSGAVRCLYRHVAADLGPFGQLFAAVHLLFDAHNAVTLHSFHLPGRFSLL